MATTANATITASLSRAFRALGAAMRAEPDVTRRLRYSRQCVQVGHLLCDALERRRALEREHALEAHRATLPRRTRMIEAVAASCPNLLDTLSPIERVVLHGMLSEAPPWLS